MTIAITGYLSTMLSISIPRHSVLLSAIKKIPGRLWDSMKNVWLIEKTYTFTRGDEQG